VLWSTVGTRWEIFGILLNFFKPGMLPVSEFTVHDNTDVLLAIGDDTHLKLT
jgi:hypothetical protein